MNTRRTLTSFPVYREGILLGQIQAEEEQARFTSILLKRLTTAYPG
jgi:hypothetical protein